MQRGVRLFRQQHSAVVGAYDILHKLALFLEKNVVFVRQHPDIIR